MITSDIPFLPCQSHHQQATTAGYYTDDATDVNINYTGGEDCANSQTGEDVSCCKETV